MCNNWNGQQNNIRNETCPNGKITWNGDNSSKDTTR